MDDESGSFSSPICLPTSAKEARNPNSATHSPSPTQLVPFVIFQLPTPRCRRHSVGIVVDSTGGAFPSHTGLRALGYNVDITYSAKQ